MTVQDITNEVRFLTKTDSSSYSDADILSGMNLYNGEILQDILRVQTTRNTALTNVAYDNLSINGLVAGQIGYNGEYPMPVDCLRPVRVELSYDGITWLPCKMYDINAGNMTSEFNPNQINSAFQTTSNPNYNPYISTPYMRVERDSFIFRPLNEGNTIYNGIVVWYESRQAALVNTTDVPAFEANFHEVLVYKLALRYAMKFPEKYNALWDKKLAEVKASLTEYYRSRFKFNSTLSASFERFK